MPRGDSVEVGAGGVGAVTYAQGIARRIFKVRVGPCLDEPLASGRGEMWVAPRGPSPHGGGPFCIRG